MLSKSRCIVFTIFLFVSHFIFAQESIPAADDYIVKWEVDETRDYSIGETISCRLNLYAGSRLSNISDFQIDCPDDAYMKNVSLPKEIEGKTIVLNQKMYTCYTIRQYEISPLSSGTFKLPVARLKIKMMRPKSSPDNGSLFDQFFSVEEYEECISTSDVTLNVVSKSTDIGGALSIESKGIAVCVDVSSSMKIKDVGQNRMACVSKIIAGLQSNSNFDRLSQYSAFTTVAEQGWSRDLNNYLDTLQKRYADGTALYDALVYPIASLSGCKNVVLISDGSDNGSHISMKTAFDILKDYEIRPFVVIVNSMRDSVMCTFENVFKEEVEKLIPNEKLEDAKFNELKFYCQSLGGDLYIVQSENDIRKVTTRILGRVSLDEKNAKTIAPSNYKENYILKNLKRDFNTYLYLKELEAILR